MANSSFFGSIFWNCRRKNKANFFFSQSAVFFLLSIYFFAIYFRNPRKKKTIRDHEGYSNGIFRWENIEQLIQILDTCLNIRRLFHFDCNQLNEFFFRFFSLLRIHPIVTHIYSQYKDTKRINAIACKIRYSLVFVFVVSTFLWIMRINAPLVIWRSLFSQFQ